MDTPRRRCFIGVLAFQGVTYQVLQNYMALAFHWGRRIPHIDFFLQVIGKKEQFRARNNLCAMALEFLTGEDDVMLMLDDDMILPTHALERLLTALDNHPKAGVVGGLYWQRGGTYRPVIQKIIKYEDECGGVAYAPKWYSPHEITGKVQQVGILGGGCMLIRVKALRELMPPIFWVDGIVGTDIHFCVRLNQAGWDAYCDTGLELGHQQEGQTLTWRTVPPHIIKYSEIGKQIEEDACEYLKLDRFDLETFAISHLRTIENYWLTKPRDTFEAVAEAYTGVGVSAIARNVFYANHHDTGVEGFAAIIDCIDKGMIHRDYPCLDYGCGIGVAAEILAKNGYQVEAYDLKDSAVLDFLSWRVKRGGYEDRIKVVPVTGPMPKFAEQYSLIVMLDVIEHLTNPHEILDTLIERLAPGGHFHTNFAAMDLRGAEEGVHQHLKLITRDEFEEKLRANRMLPVGLYTYVKRRDEEYEQRLAANYFR
jgi:2-polyprenyl-3-methyl-5-hydroxy-6-metoxy-1,4-benzoquinol methylase